MAGNPQSISKNREYDNDNIVHEALQRQQNNSEKYHTLTLTPLEVHYILI